MSHELLSWYVFCDRHGRSAEKTQLHNNLRSVQLAQAAGYKSPGWREASIEEWLRTWKAAFGTVVLSEILQEQDVATVPKYLNVLEG